MDKIITKKSILAAVLALIMVFPVPAFGLDETGSESAGISTEAFDEISTESMEPDTQTEGSDVTAAEPDMQAEEPVVQTEEPDIQAEEPAVQTEEPSVQPEEPRA